VEHPRESLAHNVMVERAPKETLARIVAEELHNTLDLEVSELRAQLQDTKDKAEAAEALLAVRTRDMDCLLRHSLRALSNALINFTTQYRDAAMAHFDDEESPNAVREARELESHIDNLADTLAEAAESVSAHEMVKNTTPGQVEAKPAVTTVATVITLDVATVASGRDSRTLSTGSVASSLPSQGSGDNTAVSHAGTSSPADSHGGARQKEFKAPAKLRSKKKPSSTVTSSSSMTDKEAAYVLASTWPLQPGGSRSTAVSPASSEAGSGDSS
jgi:hypothetical protein